MLAVIAAGPPTFAVIVSAMALWLGGRRRERKIDDVHVLVNSRLATALAEIITLKTEIVSLKRQLSASGPPGVED